MPKRTDIKRILVIGSGPIVIGQACEFDYSGAPACKEHTEDVIEVILVNSNPATIMTDPGLADRTYVEPITAEFIERVIKKERPDALLPTLGGQTGLNAAVELAKDGTLDKYGVEMIGCDLAAIERGEDRKLFNEARAEIGLEGARAGYAYSVADAEAIAERVGYPCVLRPSFTLGGAGGGIAHTHEELVSIVSQGLELSPAHEVLVEESIEGWKEYEMEVVRDKADNCIIICSIENLDPMGIHTGDSITVAPAQTLTDREYQLLRDASIAVLREIGVDTGGSNVQFAVNPKNGRLIVIEMNPRVSRSSALASKATGFPIAKIAAKLAVGYTLDELKNDITGGATPASFEPTIDYVVTKVPRFAFEKFPQANDRLTTQMKSVGEVMAIGSTFQESIQKALRGLETGKDGFTPISNDREEIVHEISEAGPERIFYVADAFRIGMTLDEVHQMTDIDMWFLVQIKELIDIEKRVAQVKLEDITKEEMLFLKKKGFSDKRLASVLGVKEADVRRRRHALDVHPVYKRVDTCAAEFETRTAYMYSTYQDECEAMPTDRRKIMVLGGGPNRIGQGIEFDYCCVHAAMALREDGYETIMVNCNPETVSTDYDTSDRLYFEPVTLEDVLEICRIEKPEGVIVQYGGQTPLKICRALEAEGVKLVGTSTDAIDCAEDRERIQKLINELGLRQPPNATCHTQEAALEAAERIGYPIVVRPSYVLGGRAMDIVHNAKELTRYMHEAIVVSEDSPVLLDHFLDDAVEMDVDAVSDGNEVRIGGLMQHVEAAGVHSGDSACSLPPYSLRKDILDEVRRETTLMAKALGVVGLMNVQFAIKGAVTENPHVYVLEVNPRASRTVTYESKTVAEQGAKVEVTPSRICVKEAVFPFAKFLGVDPVLGPEMRSTGEVMGVGKTFGEALFKSQLGSGSILPPAGTVFISVRDEDKPRAIVVASELLDKGYSLVATRGTAAALAKAGIPCKVVNKVSEGRPSVIDKIKNHEIQLVITTSNESRGEISDARDIRMAALANRVTYYTTIAGGRAAVEGIKHLTDAQVCSLQEMYAEAAKA